MHLAVQLIWLIGCSIAVPVQNEGGKEKTVQVEGRSEETVYMYPMEYNDRRSDWSYFNDVECVGRGHQAVATRNQVLAYRTDQESLIGSDQDASSWTPVKTSEWMQIGRHRIGYGNLNGKTPSGAVSSSYYYGEELTSNKKKLYCSGGAPIDYVYGIVPGASSGSSIVAVIVVVIMCSYGVAVVALGIYGARRLALDERDITSTQHTCKTPESRLLERTGGWTEFVNRDMCNQGDVEILQNWRNTHSIDDLKEIAEKKGYSAFSIGAFSLAAFKKFDYQLTVDHCSPSGGGNSQSIWIYNEEKK